MFRFEFINAIYLIFVTFWAILNGGSYYIQIFSQRYNTKFPARRPSVKPVIQDNPDKSDWKSNANKFHVLWQSLTRTFVTF